MDILTTNAAATMTSLEIADLVESRHDNVRVTIQRLADKGVIALPAAQEKPTAGRPLQVYVFSGEQGKRDSIVVVAQLSPEFTARLVDRWQELEAGAVPRTFAQALRLAAEQQERIEQLAYERDQAETERDPALATKAQIGHRREATAMATASVKTREVNKLKGQLGFNSQHATVIAVQNATGTEYRWQPLRRWCQANEVDAEFVPDPRYGKVRAWPAGAWLDEYGVDLQDLFSH